MSADDVLEPTGPGGLDQVLVDVAARRWTGSLRFVGPRPASLFFDDGRLYFAVSESHALTARELASAGIDHALWQEAGRRPGARGKFAEELLDLGCDRKAIERFVDSRLATCIASLRVEPVEGFIRSNGRHGFGTAVAFEVDRYLIEPPARIPDDTLVSLIRDVTAPVTIEAATWNALAGLVAPMRFAELADALGADTATRTVATFDRLGLVSIVSPHAPGEVPEESVAEVQPSTRSPHEATAHGRPIPSSPFDNDAETAAKDATDDDYEEYVPERVGRQTYAAIASMRANRAEPPPQEKAHALRRLIEAVRGL